MPGYDFQREPGSLQKPCSMQKPCSLGEPIFPPVQLILISIILCIPVFFLFHFSASLNSAVIAPQKYCVLTVSKDAPDSLIADSLANSGFEPVYSESTANIYADDFGSLKAYPLDQYLENTESFDPRNDGYAQKLSSFFINNNNRLFFMPIANTAWRGGIEKKITSALGTVPFSMEIIRISNSFLFWFVLQAAAAAVALAVSADKKRLVLQLPVLLAYSYGGLPGVISAGILAGLGELLKEPLDELFSRRPYGSMRERLRQYKSNFLWIGFFILLFGILTSVMDIPVIAAWTGLICFAAIEFFLFFYKRRTGYFHNFFTPVLILPLKLKNRIFGQQVLVFTIAALLGSVIFLVFPALSGNWGQKRMDFSNIPTAADYNEHMEFQNSFSYMPLGSVKSEYLHYFLGEDGLIDNTDDPEVLSGREIPPFPLDELAHFLIEYSNGAVDKPVIFYKEWFSVALLLIIFIPGQRVSKNNGKKNKAVELNYHRIAA
ncbi:MAG: hypothetical protein FWD78_10810 [Treponema sp.]|nr:hypothetical protein [Treponema sp.]